MTSEDWNPNALAAPSLEALIAEQALKIAAFEKREADYKARLRAIRMIIVGIGGAAERQHARLHKDPAWAVPQHPGANGMSADSLPAEQNNGWQPIETAPKDGTPILGWCVHEADEYWIDEDRGICTTYCAHVEGLSRVEDGPHVLVWGGGIDERSYEEPNGAVIPDWWFRYDSDFEQAANPTHWMPIPKGPTP